MRDAIFSIGAFYFALRIIMNEAKAVYRAKADMKRQKSKIATMTETEREFYQSFLICFHRSNIRDGIKYKPNRKNKGK